MTRGTRRLLIVLVLLALAVGGGVWALRPRPVRVAARTVERGLVESTVANTRAGTVKACRRSRLAPAIGGQLARLAVREGDRVEAGAVLLELWNDDLRAQLALARSEHAAAEARSKEACVVARQAEREVERQKNLHAQGITQDQEFERYESDAEARRAACEAMQAAAAVSAAQITVAQAALERTILLAPFAGIVAEVEAELGEFVTPSPPGIPMPPAIDLIEQDCTYIDAPIDEVDAARVRVGMTARVTLDAYSGVEFEGRVERVAAYVLDREKQARTVSIEVRLGETTSDRVLLPGYSADVEVLVESRPDTLRVPTECVRDGDRVLVLAGDVLEERLIRTGVANWRFTEVLEGLAEGDRVVTSLDREGVVAGARADVDDTANDGTANDGTGAR